MASNLSALNSRQLAFVTEYLKEGNGTQSAIKAGYSKKSARQQGTLLLTYPAVIEALQAQKLAALAKMEVTEDLVLAELAAIAFSNIKRFTRWTKDGELVVVDSDDIPDALAAAIESIDEKTVKSENKDGSRSYSVTKRRIKLYSKLDALGKLAEYLGLTDSMAPKVTVHLVTGIKRSQPAAPADVTIEAEPAD